MHLLPLLCAAAMLIAGSSPALAQWKWKDASGQVHLSDMPPPRDVQEKDILQRPVAVQRRTPGSAPPASPVSAAASRPTTDPELDARKAKAEAEARGKAKADEDKVAQLVTENCRRARQQLATLQSGQRIARIDSQGERVYLDDQARADETAQVQRMINSDCR